MEQRIGIERLEQAVNLFGFKGYLLVILSYSAPSMLLFEKNFIRRDPKIRETPVFSFPVYCFSRGW